MRELNAPPGKSDAVSYTCTCGEPGFVLLFYRYYANSPMLPEECLPETIDPERLAEFHHDQGTLYNLSGKVRASKEGFNITVAGSEEGIRRYITACCSHWSFSGLGLDFDASASTDSNDEMQIRRDEFFKPTPGCRCVFGGILNVRVTAEITPLGVTNYSPSTWEAVQSLEPAEFHQKCLDEKVKLVDVRNYYESRIGYFVSPTSGEAVKPPIRRFSQWPQWVKEHGDKITGNDEEKGKPQVLTYCTGGIRCEKGVRWMEEYMSKDELRDQGKIYTLKGGIAAYLTWMEDEITAGKKTAEDSLFKGRNYVFDARGSTGLAGTEPVSNCHSCGVPSDCLSNPEGYPRPSTPNKFSWGRVLGLTREFVEAVPLRNASACLARDLFLGPVNLFVRHVKPSPHAHFVTPYNTPHHPKAIPQPDIMFKRSHRSRDRVEKVSRLKKNLKDASKSSKLQRSFEEDNPLLGAAPLISPVITLMVGKEGRLFAAHEDVLCLSPFFAAVCRGKFLDAQSKRIELPDEEPEIFSCILEYLYKGDYYPRALQNKRRSTWELEDAVSSPNPENGGGRGNAEATTFVSSVGEYLLRDTVIYCLADKYGLEELKRLALRKQGLQSGIEVGTILRSARYAYDNTPDTDSRLRAHYLALIIRCRKTFKRSGTMQTEMESGGKLFFDLFVALCNHVDDIVDIGLILTSAAGTPGPPRPSKKRGMQSTRR
ncbi:hypothetical protein V501_04405 [Pseudogymnoascus sp. VKM F-4519 (FW-2642)]|nr:hypothetical protein V501_04405 [Pseudogymnoascus sp. VKM F-4519 (FW-2642)]